jgi:hypothetical protein
MKMVITLSNSSIPHYQKIFRPIRSRKISRHFFMGNFARENDASKAEINLDVLFAQGAFKNVYKGKYTIGERAGQECVCKMFKSGSVYEDSYFENELKVVHKALEIINRFNDDQIIDKRIWLNKPDIWTFVKGSSREGQKNLMEPLIANYEKFNSNSGWIPSEKNPWIEVLQALSHYSFHFTGRQLLLCDLQGGIYRDGYVLTDPVVMSMTQEYGPTDLGARGISTFFAEHQCNAFCNSNWGLPADKKKYFPVQKGSSMMKLPTRATRAPLTGKSRLSELTE